MGFEMLLMVLFLLLLANFIFLDLSVSKMKKDRLKLDVVTAITALEMATKKLNEKLKYETQSLSDYKQRLKRLEKRLDILEADHPDTDIDFGTVDDDGNITEVWFEGKRYVPEDKRSEDTNTFYADNKVAAETTRPNPQPESRYGCSDCVRFRRERIDGKWCSICSVDNVIMSNDEQYICDKFRLYRSTARLLNQNYEKTSEVPVPSDKDEVEYIRFNRIYWDMDRHNEADRVAKRIDDLQCEIQRLNMLAHMDCTAQELRQRWEELMRDDT